MLKSIEKKPVTYVGYTKNLKNRLKLHNVGKGAKSTRGRYWRVIFKKAYKNKSLALKAEYYLKTNYSIRNKIKNNMHLNSKIKLI
jgi:putative endonuclease|tara:strand:+ start:55 stop:309 length:255 start_codon:yes stop_codon:yes gene_type:complete